MEVALEAAPLRVGCLDDARTRAPDLGFSRPLIGEVPEDGRHLVRPAWCDARLEDAPAGWQLDGEVEGLEAASLEGTIGGCQRRVRCFRQDSLVQTTPRR